MEGRDGGIAHAAHSAVSAARCYSQRVASSAAFGTAGATGGYEYAKQTGTGPHAQYWRRRVADSDGNGGDAKPVLLFDANAAPALLQSAFQPGVSFMGTVRGVSAFMPSPSGRFAATRWTRLAKRSTLLW